MAKAAIRRLWAEVGFPLILTGMTCVYLIQSVNQGQQHYVGLTHDLKPRLADHKAGRSAHTKKFKPWHLVAYTGFADELTARAFESYLKKAVRGKPPETTPFPRLPGPPSPL